MTESGPIPAHPRTIRPFLLDTHEVTVGEVIQKCRILPNALRGRPELPPNDFPVVSLLFDEAVMLAEQLGKRLPTEFEYEFAATNGGQTRYPWGPTRPPADAWKLQPAGQPIFDRTATNPPMFGLFSNVVEFVDSRYAPYPKNQAAGVLAPDVPGSFAVLRGGGNVGESETEIVEQGPRRRSGHFRPLLATNAGLRCARSKSPRLKAEDF